MRRIGLTAPPAVGRTRRNRLRDFDFDLRLRRLDRRRGAARRLCGSRLPDVLDELDAVVLEDALRTPDRVTLAVQKMADAAQEIDVVGPVVAASAAAL